MKEGPDIALLGALIGDPGRANILTALMDGRSLTATELAGVAGVTQQTASAHLAKLEQGGLISQRKQGRHRYFALRDAEVGGVLEAMMGLATRAGHTRTRTGPKEPALRKARVCYNHLAGELAVAMFDRLTGDDLLRDTDGELVLTDPGRDFFTSIGIDVDQFATSRRPLCRSCLDWSMRRSHLAGALGSAILDHVYSEGWATREAGTRVVRFSRRGEQAFQKAFALNAV